MVSKFLANFDNFDIEVLANFDDLNLARARHRVSKK